MLRSRNLFTDCRMRHCLGGGVLRSKNPFTDCRMRHCQGDGALRSKKPLYRLQDEALSGRWSVEK